MHGLILYLEKLGSLANGGSLQSLSGNNETKGHRTSVYCRVGCGQVRPFPDSYVI